MTPPQSQTLETDAFEENLYSEIAVMCQKRKRISEMTSHATIELFKHARSLETRLNEVLANQKTGGDFLFHSLAERLIKRIVAATDFTQEGATDIELSLARIIQERTSLLAQKVMDDECISRIQKHGYENEIKIENLLAQIAVKDEALKNLCEYQTATELVECVELHIRPLLTNSPPAAQEMVDELNDLKEETSLCRKITGEVSSRPLSTEVQEMVERMERMEKELNTARGCLVFFKSVINCGEPWTTTCQNEYDKALSTTKKPEGGV